MLYAVVSAGTLERLELQEKPENIVIRKRTWRVIMGGHFSLQMQPRPMPQASLVNWYSA